MCKIAYKYYLRQKKWDLSNFAGTAPKGAFFLIFHKTIFKSRSLSYDVFMKKRILTSLFIFMFLFMASFYAGIVLYPLIFQKTELKKATLYVFPSYQKNKAFDMRYGQYNYRYIFPALQKMFLKHGYKLATQDIHPMESSDLIFTAWPYAELPPLDKKNVSYLWLFESPLGIKLPLDKKTQERYNKIFTYSKPVADNRKYIHLYDPYHFDTWNLTDEDIKNKDIFVIQIASNFVYPPSSKTIYEERRTATTWFLKNRPQDYTLYGKGYWDLYRKGLSTDLVPIFDMRYKGSVKNKHEMMRRAKFALVYENMRYNDYVSEKIYDAINAGTVPIYLGAPNIREYVPEACFIDKDKFGTYEELYDFIKNMSDEVYMSYISCMQNFVSPSNKTRVQDIDKAIQTIEKTIFHQTPEQQFIENIKCYIQMILPF